MDIKYLLTMQHNIIPMQLYSSEYRGNQQMAFRRYRNCNNDNRNNNIRCPRAKHTPITYI